MYCFPLNVTIKHKLCIVNATHQCINSMYTGKCSPRLLIKKLALHAKKSEDCNSCVILNTRYST